jgi:hypothetical protein
MARQPTDILREALSIKPGPYDSSVKNFQVYSGRMVNPTCTKKEDIRIGDIAKSLSLQCRFNGHIKDFYSVAQHSCLVHKLFTTDYLATPQEAKTAFMHDATEAYLMDIPTPLKVYLPDYIEWEKSLWSEMAEKFDLLDPIPNFIMQFDKVALNIEMNNLFKVPRNLYVPKHLNPEPFVPLPPKEAELAFLELYSDLFDD